jgi:hypothetical protein
MQIHEITLTEANPPRMPVKTGLARQAQQRSVAPPPQAPAAPQLTPAQQLAQADQAEMQSRRAQAAQIPGAGPMTQAFGNYIANKIGPRGLPSQKAAAAAKTQASQPVHQLNPVLTKQLQGMANKLNLPTQTTTVSSPAAPVAPAQTTAPAPAAPAQTTAPAAPAQTTAPKAVAPAQTYPPITIGAGPKATVYVNKGKGYVDNKTGKPIPPAILKAMRPV